jgi:hypothetical protein
MEPATLDFFTTNELIQELMRRKTFLGVIVQAEQELKSTDWAGTQVFKVHLNENMDSAQASRLFDAISDYINQNS